MKKRYTVLSYIIGDYEVLHEIGEKDPDAEYVMVTDNPELKSETWDVVYDKSLEGLSTFDKCYAIRFNCFKYAKSDICLRIDGSMKVKHSLKPLIDIFEAGSYDAALMPHPFNDNFIKEYELWVSLRGYPSEQAAHCIEDMRRKGYDFNYKGMFQGGFTIFRNNELTRNIETKTFNYPKELGSDGTIERIDQIPFSFVLNTYFSDIKVLPISEQILRSYYIQMYEHHGCYPNMNSFYDREKPDIHYMFDKPVTCLYLEAPSDSLPKYEKDVAEETKFLVETIKVKDLQLHAKVIYYHKKIKKLSLMFSFTVVLLFVLVIFLAYQYPLIR